MNGPSPRLLRLVQLRRLRVRQAEQALHRSLDALESGRSEHLQAAQIQAAWVQTRQELADWMDERPPADRIRWAEMAASRAADIERSLVQAQTYLEWWEQEVIRLDQQVSQARSVWRRQQQRLDALVRRRDAESRRAAFREEETAFQELADASATQRAQGAWR